jgi:hypothetical protein
MQSQHGVALHSFANAQYRAGQQAAEPARTQRLGEAAGTFEKAIAVQKKAVEEMPDFLDYRKLLGYHFRLLAEVRTQLNQPQGAVAAVQSAAEQALERQKLSPSDPAVLVAVAAELCQCVQLLGPGPDRKAERDRYAEQAIAIVRRAVELGFKDGKRLQQPDFAPLRGMAGFESIIKRLEG